MAITKIRYRSVVCRKLTGDETNYMPADQIYSSAPTGFEDGVKWIQTKMAKAPGEFSHGVVHELKEEALWDSRCASKETVQGK